MGWEYPPSFPELLKTGGGGKKGDAAGGGGLKVFNVFFLLDWVRQRFVEQIPSVVDIPVIMHLQFQQSLLFFDVKVPQIQFIDGVLSLQLCSRGVQKTVEMPGSTSL